MFLSAHIVVKLVMIGLALASFLTWTVALAKGIELIAAKRRVRDALRMLAQVTSLTEAAGVVGSREQQGAGSDVRADRVRVLEPELVGEPDDELPHRARRQE